MTGITNLLTNFVNNLINIKLIGLINVFSFKDVKPALQKLISNDSSRNSEIMRSSSINEKIIKKSESEIARFDGWDLGIKRSNEIKELFCDIFKNENEEIKIILQEFFKTIKEDPFLDFFGIDLLKDYFKMIKKEIRNTNKFQNLKMIRKDIFRNFVINLENDKIKLMFESTYDLILNIRDQSENITSNIRKRSPPSPNSPTKQKYPLSDYIKTSFKKISQRIYNFSMNDNDDLQDYNEVTNTMDRFYNLEKNQLEKEKELNKINNNPKHAEDNEENIFEYIEKVNSFIKENDPKIKYSKLNLKKNVFNKNKDTKKDFDERGYDKLTDEEFHEMERSKLKNSVFEENSPFSKNKKYKKSLSMYENISNHSLYPQRSKEAKEIKKYTKEAELISKIYRMDKKISTKNLFEFTNDLIIEKKLKSLHFKQETNDFRSFNYLKKNDLYERRRIESQTIRNRIKKNAITLPISWDTKNKQDFLRKTTNTLKFKNTSEKNFIVRSKTTNNKFRTNKKMHSMELDYDILFERKPEYIFPELELPEFLMLKNNNSNYFESKSILIQPVIT